MKTKISISLSKELIKMVDKISENYMNRSAFIEYAINSYIETSTNMGRNNKDLKIINKHAKRLNKEALDVLSYQGFS